MLPYLFAILSAAGIGLNNTCVQLGMRFSQVTGAQALIINLITGNALLIIVSCVVFMSQGFPELNFLGIVFFTAAGLMGPFFGRLLSFSAIKRIGATRTVVYRMGDMFFTMLLSYFILKNDIRIKGLIGAVILAAGVVILIKEKSKQVKPNNEVQGNSINNFINEENKKIWTNFHLFFNSGVILALICGLFFALGGIFRELGINSIPSAILGTLLSTFVALIANSIYSFYSKQWGSNWNISGKSLMCFVVGGVGNSLGILTFFLALVNEVPVFMVAALKNTAPVFTLIFSWIALRKVEHFSIKLLVSIFLVIIGSSLIVY
ncbi:MAG: EamA family transporter [Dehalobacterium sp.]